MNNLLAFNDHLYIDFTLFKYTITSTLACYKYSYEFSCLVKKKLDFFLKQESQKMQIRMQ